MRPHMNKNNSFCVLGPLVSAPKHCKSEVGAGLQDDGPEVAFPDLAVAGEDSDSPE